MVLACALPACGGGAGQHQVALRSSNRDCDFKGITAAPYREGVCVARGVTITVADKAHWLSGQDYDARISEVRTHGGVVRLTLNVRNTLETPHEFDQQSDLVFLLVDNQYFRERPRLEADRALKPFRLRRTPLQPGEVATGTVSFRLPHRVVGHLTSTGSDVILVNYDDESKGFPTGTQQLGALGYLRLWK